ncbi:MAG: hypothetical protein FGM61_05220 [Sediminibacterium sp.]|nr:hypothetical protein [Sediminibacterium sp.]
MLRASYFLQITGHLSSIVMAYLCFVFIACSPAKSLGQSGKSSSRKTNVVEVTGSGITEEEARMNAEAKAIISTIGSFVSQETKIENDRLLYDKITEIAAGTITKVEIVKPYNGSSLTIKAHVSVTEVMTFCKNNGIGAEIQGSAIASEFNRQQRNERGEGEVLSSLNTKLSAMLKRSFDFKVMVDEPTINTNSKNNITTQGGEASDEFVLPLTVEVTSNGNFKVIYQEIMNTLKGIAMTPSEVETYKKMGKDVYQVSVFSEDDIRKHYSDWNTGYGMFPNRTSKNTVYLRKNPREFFYSLFGEESVLRLNRNFSVRMTGTNDHISGNECKPIEKTNGSRFRKYEVNTYAPYMYMSQLRKTPIDRIKYYSYDQVLVIPAAGGVITGVFILDYKVDLEKLKQYKKIEVVPVN